MKSLRIWIGVLAVAVGCVVGVGAFRATVRQGYLVPVRIAGQSMAPTFRGPHFGLTCESCGIALRFSDIRARPRQGCANCGSPVADIGKARPIPADRVLIDKLTLRTRAPQRGDMVALEDPEHSGRRVVKRIVGLPGERICIQDSVLQIDGKPNSPPSSRSLILVNDDRYRDPGGGRWVAERSGCWKRVADGFRIEPSNRSNGIDWISYQHENGSPGLEPYVIYDDNAFNVGVTRSVHPAPLVRVEGNVRMDGNGSFFVRCQTGDDTWSCQIDVGEVYGTTELAPRVRHQLDTPDVVFRIVANRSWIQLELGSGMTFTHLRPTAQPGGLTQFSLGAADLHVQLSNLVVLKSASVPADSPEPAVSDSWSLEDDEYFLLGDNAAVSIDSRHWLQGVHKSHLIGIVRHFRRMRDAAE